MECTNGSYVVIDLDLISESGQGQFVQVLNSGSSRTPAVEEENIRRRRRLAKLISHILSIGYYTCIFPFRLKKLENGDFDIKRNAFQQIICGYVHIMVQLQMIAYVRLHAPEKNDILQHASLYVDFFFMVANYLFVLISQLILWLKPTWFLQISNFIENENSLPIACSWVTGPWSRYLFQGYLIFKMLFNLVTVYEVVHPFWEVYETPMVLYCRLVSIGKYNMFLTSELLVSDSPDCDVSFLNVLIAVCALITKFGGYAFFDACYSLMYVCTIQLWVVSKAFLKYTLELRNIGDDWSRVRSQFLSIQKLSGLINKATGLQLITYIFLTSLGYSVGINILLLSSSLPAKFLVTCSIIVTIIIFWTSAQSHTTIDRAKRRIREARDDEQIPNAQANHILEEQDIGIRPVGIFGLTYSLLGLYLITTLPIFLACALDLKGRVL